jgi:hypothetical protein
MGKFNNKRIQFKQIYLTYFSLTLIFEVFIFKNEGNIHFTGLIGRNYTNTFF